MGRKRGDVYAYAQIKGIKECPKCGYSGTLYGKWTGWHTTTNWNGPLFSISHTKKSFNKEQYQKLRKDGLNSVKAHGLARKSKSTVCYIGKNYPDPHLDLSFLTKTPPSREEMAHIRVQKGWSLPTSKNPPCIHCGHKRTYKSGKRAGVQRYVCSECGRRWSLKIESVDSDTKRIKP